MARWDKDQPLVWFPQIPSCNSSSSSSDTSRRMQSRYDPEKESLYNFWSSDSQKRGAFLRTFSVFDFSLCRISSFKNSTMGSIQLGPTLTWWTCTISLFPSVVLHKSSTRMTWGKLFAEEVAIVASEAVCVFPLLGMCNRLKDSNPDCNAWLDSSIFAFSHPSLPILPLLSQQPILSLRTSLLPFRPFFELWPFPSVGLHTKPRCSWLRIPILMISQWWFS